MFNLLPVHLAVIKAHLTANLSWVFQFASLCATMSLFKFFQDQGKDPNCESVETTL